MAQARSFVVGTAGHIDHGKSALVRALTGIDPDRLAEEKERGITIELGFASLDLPGGVHLGIVDVPGHERFVRQMISGATGIDLALLCIAADDGVMPQTREHLAVLEVLGIASAVVAITKADAVDGEWLAYVKDEVARYLQATAFSGAPIVAVSSVTGQGLDELKDALGSAVDGLARDEDASTVRYPVDRVFTIRGAGTVVTGTLWSGEVTAGDRLAVLPSGIQSRVRGVQIHGEDVDVARAGNRVAINLADVSTDEVRPGDFLVSPGDTGVTDRFDARLAYLGDPESPKPLKSGSRVHVAHGTREVVGRVLFMDGVPEVAPGSSAFAQIRLDKTLPVRWKDRFVIRSYSPVTVIGGGKVLRAHPRRTTNLGPQGGEFLAALDGEDTAAIVRAAFRIAGCVASAESIAALSGLTASRCEDELATMAQGEGICRIRGLDGGSTAYATDEVIERFTAAIARELHALSQDAATAEGVTIDDLRQRVDRKVAPDVFEALLAQAVAANAAHLEGGRVLSPQAAAGNARASDEAQSILGRLLAEAGTTPPSEQELIASSGLEEYVARRALDRLVAQGDAVRVGETFVFASEALAALEKLVCERLEQSPANAAALKEAMGTTRKYAIPLLEHFDEAQVTVRDGDLRYLRKGGGTWES